MFVAEQLARWAAAAPSDHPPAVLEAAAHAIRDAVGCMAAGAGDEGAARVRDAVARWGAGDVTVVGALQGASAPLAALANGMAGHALDFDDTFMVSVTHASSVLVAALLALAEDRDASGAALLDAYVVGLDLHAALGRGLIRSHYDQGWHATATIGCIGTAGACARLLGLDAGRFAHALSLGVSMAAGPKVQFGSMAKPLHAGLAAQHAVEAAMLAEAGVEGRLNALEGPMGFLELCGGPSPAGWDHGLDRIGDPPAVICGRLMTKRFPCCAATHRALDCVLELKAREGFAAPDVAAIDAVVGRGQRRNLMYDNPQSEMEARFSMPYCVAVALLHGAVRLGDFTPAAVHRPEVRALLGLTTLRAHDPKDEPADPAAPIPTVVTITLKDGRTLRATRAMPKGSGDEPLDAADREAKFADCCEGLLPAANLAALRPALGGLESLEGVGALARLLRFEAGADRGERFERRPARRAG